MQARVIRLGDQAQSRDRHNPYTGLKSPSTTTGKLADVLGEFDANLALIENKLGVKAVVHRQRSRPRWRQGNLLAGQGGSGDALSAGQKRRGLDPRRCRRADSPFVKERDASPTPGISTACACFASADYTENAQTNGAGAHARAIGLYPGAPKARKWCSEPARLARAKPISPSLYAAGCLEDGARSIGSFYRGLRSRQGNASVSAWGYEGKSRSLFAPPL